MYDIESLHAKWDFKPVFAVIFGDYHSHLMKALNSKSHINRILHEISKQGFK